MVRRAAITIAARIGGGYSEDSWGNALQFFRTAGVIGVQEKQILASAYMFNRPGAHVPKDITEEEWARLNRTLG